MSSVRNWSVVAALALCAACGDSLKDAYAEGQAAQTLLEAGDIQGANVAIERALALHDDQAELLLIKGRIKYQLKDMAGAFDAYSLALAIDPSNAEALQAVSQLGMAVGADRQSEDATNRILALDPMQADALLAKGVQLLNRRDYSGVRAIGEKMLNANPASEGGTVLKARALFLSGNQEAALEMLRAAVARTGNTRVLATALLECARDQHDAALMLQQFAALRTLLPSNVDLAIDEINVRYKTGDKLGAQQRAVQLISEQGGDEDAMQRLRDVWEEYDQDPLNETQVARLAADGKPAARMMVARYILGQARPAAFDPLIGPLRGDLAQGLRYRIAWANGDSRADQAADKLLELDITNCDALAVRALAFLKRRDPRAAVIPAQSLAAACPDRDDGFTLMVAAYGQARDPGGVRRAFAEGIASRPLSTTLVQQYSDWLLATGRNTPAIGAAQAATRRTPAKLSAWRNLAAICSRAGDRVCANDAAAGLEQAKQTFVIDLPPGQRPVNPLLGNQWR